MCHKNWWFSSAVTVNLKTNIAPLLLFAFFRRRGWLGWPTSRPSSTCLGCSSRGWRPPTGWPKTVGAQGWKEGEKEDGGWDEDTMRRGEEGRGWRGVWSSRWGRERQENQNSHSRWCLGTWCTSPPCSVDRRGQQRSIFCRTILQTL